MIIYIYNIGYGYGYGMVNEFPRFFRGNSIGQNEFLHIYICIQKSPKKSVKTLVQI